MISRSACAVSRTTGGSAPRGISTLPLRPGRLLAGVGVVGRGGPAAAAAQEERLSSPLMTGASRFLSSSSTSNLPYHLVVGLPALSPTMASGALAEWYVAEGDKFGAGDAVAKIETDKASMDFEAQDDGYVAKLLMEAGTGMDIPVNTPIMITVEDEDHVAAFKNYVPPAVVAAAAPAAAAVEAPPAPTKVETAPPPPPPKEAAPAPAPVAAAPAPVASPPAAATGAVPSSGTSPAAVAWGSLIRTASPLAKSMGKKQRAYVERYGTTGQPPVF